MREAAFVKLHRESWDDFEQSLAAPKKTHPDKLADLFIKVTDDLAFSQTQYPGSQTTLFLNNLAAKAHRAIYRNKQEDKKRFVRFWKSELPQLFKSAHKQLLYAFLLFLLAFLIGIVSSANDETFVRLILSDSYVNMTLENIEKGDPMAVYKSMGSGDMFMAITFNNIRVSFIAFAMGVLLSIGTGVVLFTNGVMLGAFQYLFYQKGLLLTSFLTIWIHGTLEISAIIIAGGAGFVMGNSILFPGTYSRRTSFRRGARKGLKMVMGLIPIFMVAGFLESFITRMTDIHWLIKASIIGLSALFIIYYFIVYPYQNSND